MRCHFQLIKGDEVIRDVDGIEIAEPEAENLMIEIARAMREIKDEDSSAADSWSGWQLKVVTEDGRLIVDIALDDYKGNMN